MSTSTTLDRPSFIATQTHLNLRTACLGEMHARRLYLQAARKMEEASLHVIAHAFDFTAAQEKEHTDVLRGLLAAHGGDDIPPAEDVPLLLPDTPPEILQAVTRNEQSESDTLYPYYARIAAEEGYPRIAEAFRRIAEVEKQHALRFHQYAQSLADGTLFRDDRPMSWVCLPCGQLHSGCEAPDACAACGKNRGHFIRSSFYPFTIEG